MNPPSSSRTLGLCLVFALSAFAASPARAGALWYNGDYDGRDAIANATNSFAYNVGGNVYGYSSFVLDNFTVPTGQTWTITSVFSNDQFYFNPGNFGPTVLPTTATWAILSNVVAGQGATTVATGDTAATVTPGQVADGVNYQYNEYQVAASVPSVVLGAGTYWLTVAPDDPTGAITNFSGIETTSGANAIGQPQGNDGNSFIVNTLDPSNPNSQFYTPLSTYEGDPAGTYDASMGVVGTSVAAAAVPEPSSLTMLALAALVGSIPLIRRLRRDPS